VPCEARDVLRTLGDHDRARRLVLDHIRVRGGEMDRWTLRKTREVTCDALTHAEDVIEHSEVGKLRPYNAADRVALREIRQRLELELWP